MANSNTDIDHDERERAKRLDELYQLLRKYRDYILSKFDDIKLSDEDYFKYGISYDIVNNALNIVMSGLARAERSLGLDNNARAILEAFMILKIDKNGEIDSEMKRIYRLSYSAVEYANEKSAVPLHIVKDKEEEMRKKDYEELIEVAMHHFGCSRRTLLNNYGIDSPYLFLMKDPADRTSFESVIHKYHVYISKDFNDAYDFFSLFVHPNFMMYDLDKIYSRREEYLKALFPYVLDYIDRELPRLDSYKNVQSALSFFYFSKDGRTLSEQLNRTDSILRRLFKLIPNDADPYTRYLLLLFGHLIGDTVNCYYFKLDDLVTPKFKSFIEYSSVCLYFMGIKTIEEYDYRLDGLYLGTLFRFKRWENDFTGDKEISDLVEKDYLEFYGKVYSINGIEGFKYNLETQLLYFVQQKNYPYARLVKNEIGKSILTEERKKEIITLYKVSLDMEHASGYVFNQSADVSEFYALETLKAMYSILLVIFTHYEAALKNKNPGFRGLESEISYINRKIKEYEKLEKKYL
ncbi:MAG: hypothetical protein LUB56_00940 [Coprobacillus sp.]|nr:hypothetical protein [Coprobacillus sp.]